MKHEPFEPCDVFPDGALVFQQQFRESYALSSFLLEPFLVVSLPLGIGLSHQSFPVTHGPRKGSVTNKRLSKS
jgi:hypothetical protein